MSIDKHNFEDVDIDHVCVVGGPFDDKGLKMM